MGHDGLEKERCEEPKPEVISFSTVHPSPPGARFIQKDGVPSKKWSGKPFSNHNILAPHKTNIALLLL